MVEADAHAAAVRARPRRSADRAPRPCAPPASRPARACRLDAPRARPAQRVVGGRDDHDVDVGPRDGARRQSVGAHVAPRPCRASAAARSRSTSAQATSRAPPERRGALPADQPAADDGDARTTHRRPTSCRGPSGRCGAGCRRRTSSRSARCAGRSLPRIPHRAEQAAGDAVARGRGEEHRQVGGTVR